MNEQPEIKGLRMGSTFPPVLVCAHCGMRQVFDGDGLCPPCREQHERRETLEPATVRADDRWTWAILATIATIIICILVSLAFK